MEEEPASKKIKLEVVEVDLPEEETEADLELDQWYDIDECYKASIRMKKGGGHYQAGGEETKGEEEEQKVCE